MNRTHHFIRALMLGGLFAVSSAPAYAADGAAITQYKKGRMLIEQRQYEQALVELEKSNAQMPSPNTLLLIAHANRELGRIEAAANLYEQVIQDAEARVTAGEPRFQMTANDAHTWLDKIAKDIGWLGITITNAAPDVIVRVKDKVVTPTSSEGGAVKFNKIWVTAGSVTVTADQPGRAPRRVTVDVPRGGPATVVMDLSLASEPDGSSSAQPPAATPEKEERASRTVPMGTWIAGGVGVVGLATFAVFGSMARSKSNQLDACSPRCPESERSTADDGKRDQTIGNVGLIVGGIGAATALGLYVWQPSPAGDREVGVAIVPGGVNVAGTF